MTEQTTIPDWESIPDREPLPDMGGGRGPGLSDESINKVKASEIIDDDIAVIGYLILPNQFKKEEDDPDEYALVEIVDVDGNNFVFSTSSKALTRALEARDERQEIPFKTSLTMRKSAAGRDYYVFT